jgi:hypothetical protein
MKSMDQRSLRGCGSARGVRIGAPFALALAPRVAVHAIDPLVISVQPFPRHQSLQPSMAIPGTDGGVRL